MVGRDITVEELVSEAVKDRYYYNESKGGVTVSGGEPALQAEFLYGLVKALKEEKLHVALETSGFCDNRILESVLPYVDLFLYDCKETDHELHKRYTGVDDTLILENLKWLHDVKARIILRCPVIAGLNDRADHFQGIAALAGEYPNLEGVELLPYHKLGVSKAERMGLARTEIYRQPPQDMADTWNRTVRALGVKMID
jgi:pyruvate formate lyase activating enzyme